MKDLVKKVELEFLIESAISRSAIQSICDRYDLLIGINQENLQDIYRICGGNYDGKMHLTYGILQGSQTGR